MHEVGITKDFVEAIQKQVDQRTDVGRVIKIQVCLGRSLEISSDVLRFWFDHFARGTKLAGAELDINLVDGKTLDVATLDVE